MNRNNRKSSTFELLKTEQYTYDDDDEDAPRPVCVPRAFRVASTSSLFLCRVCVVTLCVAAWSVAETTKCALCDDAVTVIKCAILYFGYLFCS